MAKGHWFKSDLFTIHKGEDEETNPGCYGKELAEWLCIKFSNLGYEAEVLPEDWGWLVICENDEYLLWVGCGAMGDEIRQEDYDPDNPPKGSDVTWHAFAVIEVPFFWFKSLLKKWTGKLDLDTPLKKLEKELEEILSKDPQITSCDEP